ncbi:NADPH oxidase organizer 1 [Podarcis lilfordi]|uniref:NADPH oxidase organizer 1 n=1 Tax=Podarcis lilfordi TaxID=74358 RepID=A0AA35L9S1_9SAUR|nr:NADPH oxidase organizer 1 [Podarcis lilfordi]
MEHRPLGEMSSGRFPVEVKAVGLLKHRKQKVWMLLVSWSDQNNILIYREFEEFKKLHKDLKKKFPIESGLLKKSDRTIPRFRDVNVMLKKNQKLSRCRESLMLLEIYCQELLKTKARISQGEDVVHFFEAQSRDMDPSFPENSIVILPSEMGPGKKETPLPPSTTITQPVMSQSYRCIEAYETKDTSNRLFRATKGEILEVLMKDKTGWWLVENYWKQIAWFPAPYLEETEEAAATEETKETGMLYYVTRAYEAKKSDELSVKIGVVVEVLEKSDDGWWLVWYNGTTGYVPSMFLQPYRNPHSKFLALVNSSLCYSMPNLSQATSPLSKSSPSQQRGSCEGAAQVHSTNMTMEMQEYNTPPSRMRSHSLSVSVAVATSGLASGVDCLSDSSGNVSGQGYDWPQNPEVNRVRNSTPGETLLLCSSRSHGCLSPPLESKHRSDSGFEEQPLGSSDTLLRSSDSEPASGHPTIPPRPQAHEILQRCTTITRRALRGALARASPTASSQACH